MTILQRLRNLWRLSEQPIRLDGPILEDVESEFEAIIGIPPNTKPKAEFLPPYTPEKILQDKPDASIDDLIK